MKFNIICISVAIGLLSNSIQAAPIANNAVPDTEDYAQKLTKDVTSKPVGALGGTAKKRDGPGEILDLNNLGKRGGVLGGLGGGDNIVGEETPVGSGSDGLGKLINDLIDNLKKRGDDLLDDLDNLDIDVLKKRQLSGTTSGLTKPVADTLGQLKLAETTDNVVSFATKGPLDTSTVTSFAGVKRFKSNEDDAAAATDDADADTDKKKKQDSKSDKSDKSITDKDGQPADAEKPTDVDAN